MSNWLLFAGVTAALCWTFIPLSRNTSWWVRAFEFPRAQFLFLTAAMALCLTALGDPGSRSYLGPLVLLLVCGAVQVRRILPYTILYRHQMRTAQPAPGQQTIGVLVANVYMPNRNSRGLLAQVDIHEPDLVLTLESDEWWGSELDVLRARYPFNIRHPRDNTYGMHLYSRLPLHDSHVRFLVEDDVPSIHTTVTLADGHRVKLHCVHPAPPSPSENATSNERDAELLIVARDVDPGRDSVIVTGDLNDVAWSATTRMFQRVSGLLDPRIGRGMFATFHARTPWLRWPLDHLFASADFALASIDVLEPFGSDHLPVLIFLQRDPSTKKEHDEPEPQHDDDARLKRKVAHVDAENSALP